MRIFAVFAVLAGLWSAPVSAQSNPVVVELFTSQGCSSCPPADAYLHELAKRDDVVALALHVDYWDYIGWKDSFADPAHGNRQRAYAAENGRRMIYTPQMVINGREHVVGNSPKDVAEIIDRHAQQPDSIVLRTRDVDGAVVIEADPATKPMTLLSVHLVRYAPESTVEITRGENAGRTLSYANVVTEMTQIGVWSGEEPLNMTVPMDGTQPAVVILQRKNGAGQIEATARLN